MVPHQPDDDDRLVLVEPQVADDPRRDLGADLAVPATPGLADVVEQCGDEEQVRPLHPASERTRVRRRLHEVPVDGEAMHGIALGR